MGAGKNATNGHLCKERATETLIAAINVDVITAVTGQQLEQDSNVPGRKSKSNAGGREWRQIQINGSP
jgi:hypothetical protein